jgi:hypothetical protein
MWTRGAMVMMVMSSNDLQTVPDAGPMSHRVAAAYVGSASQRLISPPGSDPVRNVEPYSSGALARDQHKRSRAARTRERNR